MTEPPRTTSGWSVRHAVLAIGAGLVAAIVAASVVFTVTGEDLTDPQTFAILTVQASVTIVAAVVIVARLGRRSLAEAVGLRFALRDLWGVPIAVALQIVLAITLIPFLELLGIEGPPQEVGRITQGAEGAIVALAFVSVVVLAPLAEELAFRGLLLRALLDRFRELGAVLISAAAFAALHLLDPGAAVVVPQLFVVGVVLALMVTRTGTMGMAVVTHTTFNLTAFLALLFLVD